MKKFEDYLIESVHSSLDDSNLEALRKIASDCNGKVVKASRSSEYYNIEHSGEKEHRAKMLKSLEKAGFGITYSTKSTVDKDVFHIKLCKK